MPTYNNIKYLSLPQQVEKNRTDIEDIAVETPSAIIEAQILALQSNDSKINKLINGNFNIWQRGDSFANLDAVAYFADRWANHRWHNGATLPDFTITKRTLSANELLGSKYSMKIEWDGDSSNEGNTTRHMMIQRIPNGCYYFAGKKMTVSFWAKSNITGKRIGINIHQNYADGSGIDNTDGKYWTLTNQWQKYEFTWTLPDNEGKTFGTSEFEIELQFYVMWGESYKSRFESDDIETYIQAGYVEYAQIQLERSDYANPFEHISEDEEFLLCGIINDPEVENSQTGSTLISDKVKEIDDLTLTKEIDDSGITETKILTLDGSEISKETYYNKTVAQVAVDIGYIQRSGLIFVSGSLDGGATVVFSDLIIASTLGTHTVIASSSRGSSATRTYTLLSDRLQLEMSAGSYAVVSQSINMRPDFI